jgi:hypothetical protein
VKRLIVQVPALVIAAIALLVALTGFATAGPDATTASVTPAQARAIAKAEVMRLAPTLSVKSARTATTALTANSPALYAQVTAAGIVTASSRGIVQANVSHPEPGIYCFSGLPQAPKGGLVVVDSNANGGGSGPDLAQVGITTLRRCPGGSGGQAHVATFARDEGGPFLDDPFFVVFWF